MLHTELDRLYKYDPGYLTIVHIEMKELDVRINTRHYDDL